MTSMREGAAPELGAVEEGDEAMVERLWQRARVQGISRRRFLELMAAGGAAAVLAACIDLEDGEDADESSPWFKDTEPFIEHAGKSLEARLELMDEVITPTRLFFVRNNSPSSIDVDAGGLAALHRGRRRRQSAGAELRRDPPPALAQLRLLPRMRGQPPRDVRAGERLADDRLAVEHRGCLQRRVDRPSPCATC